MRSALLIVASILVLAGLWLGWLLNDVPSLEPWSRYELSPAAGSIAEGELEIVFLGVSTLVVRDAETTLLTDGFFSRPGLLEMAFGRIEPDPERIAAALRSAGVREAKAVIVVHSHYDHSMDAPEVARRAGALLIGSESTANVGRGLGLSEDRIVVPRPGTALELGAFRVTLIESEHFPHGMAMGEITEPLVPPARAFDYLEGGSFSVLIEHPAGSLLVQGSAGWRDGALSGTRADVVLLGIGGLGGRDEAYREGYWSQVVEAARPRWVIPIHWDDFTRPLDQPLRPMPRLQDDFEATMRFLASKADGAPGLELALLPPLEPVRLPLRRGDRDARP